MKLKKTIIAFLCGIMVGSCTLVYAAPTSSSVIASLKKQVASLQSQVRSLTSEKSKLQSQVNYYKSHSNTSVGNGKIFIDGVPVSSAKFANIDGKQYVSLDEAVLSITNRGDSGFSYDKNKKELYIGAKPINGETFLTSLKYYDVTNSDRLMIDKWKNGSSFSINGKNYLRGIGFEKTTSAKTIIYKTNGNYSIFKFKVGMDDSIIGTGDEGKITISTDNNVIYDSSWLQAQDEPISKELDISGVKVLKIDLYSNTHYNDDSTPVIVEPILIP